MSALAPGVMTDFGFAAGVYFILTILVYWGFPPFYRHSPMSSLLPGSSASDLIETEKFVKWLFPHFLAMGASLLLSIVTERLEFFLVMGVAAVWGGLRLRKDLRMTIGPPLPWIDKAWTVKWPLLIFDLWTLSFPLLFIAAKQLL